MTKPQVQDKPIARQERTVSIVQGPGKTRERQLAEVALSSVVNNAVTAASFGGSAFAGGADIGESITITKEKSAKVVGGDMSEAERMLFSQAQSLETIFNALALRAHSNINAGYMQAADTYLRLAMKAQSQCRTTLETLSEIKNPRGATFIRQQNNAQQQQVNNETSTHARARPREKDITPSNELLEAAHGKRMDTGATQKAIGADPVVAPMGAVKRPQVARRTSAKQPQRV